MENFVSNGRDRNGLVISWRGASPYKGVWIQSKLENGRRIWWAYTPTKNGEGKKLGTKGWGAFLYGSEDPREAAYVAQKFSENREENLKVLASIGRPTNRDSKCWGDTITIPKFKYEAITIEQVTKAREERKAIMEAKKAAKNDRPFRKARRGIGSY